MEHANREERKKSNGERRRGKYKKKEKRKKKGEQRKDEKDIPAGCSRLRWINDIDKEDRAAGHLNYFSFNSKF